MALHIDKSLQVHFAIEQLGLSWEEVSVIYDYQEYKYYMKVKQKERLLEIIEKLKKFFCCYIQ